MARRILQAALHSPDGRYSVDVTDWIRLSVLSDSLSRPLVPAIDALGGPEGFLGASTGEREAALGGLPATTRLVAEGILECSMEERVRALAPLDARIVSYWDREYPAGLRDLDLAPVCLFVRGSTEAFARRSVAIVGSRQAHAYGLDVARTMARGLAEAGVVVVSGLALGVDTAAHRGCLEGHGPTVAVTACGIDVNYPSRNASLREEIIAGGGMVVSEFPPRREPCRDLFVKRNRVIAAMSLVTVAVGAREKSGALITARWAADLGRDVAAVPGSIRDPFNRGSHLLIQEGAHVVDGPEAVLALLGIDPGEGRVPHLDLDSLSPDERVVFDALSHRPCHRDELAERCGLGPAALSTALTLLGARNLARALPGGSYVRGV